MKILLILSAFTFAKVQGEKVNRADEKKKIMNGCLEMSKDVADKKKAICTCIVENFDKKIKSDYQLKVLAENYNPKTLETENTEKVASAEDNFDYEVATECTNNPKWRIKE